MSRLVKEDFQQQMLRGLFWSLLFLVVARLVAMIYMPLNDSTEARYGEIARIMLETNNWITPMHQYNVPFWAKPPLSTWLSALTMKYFGVTAFAARLPALLLSGGILALVWGIARQRGGQRHAIIATLVLAGTLYFYLDAGTVMTDPALLFCTTLMMLAFWRAVVGQQQGWAYVFFVAMGLGLLAKGPVALILTGMPIGLWVIINKQWSALWQRLPWIKGMLLLGLIAFPWYYLAEMKTPGFLQYFIVGEHISRFLQPGWQGDKYGFAHVAPLGMIWVYAMLGTLPWCIPAGVWVLKYRKKIPALCGDKDGWVAYLLFWMFTPLVFFTFARNIIYPYVFPILPAFALLFAEGVARTGLSEKKIRGLFPVALTSGWIFLLVTLFFITKPAWVSKSQDRVAMVFNAQHPRKNSHLIYWSNKTDYSAQFYSGGRAIATVDPTMLCQLLAQDATAVVVVNLDDGHALPPAILAQLTEIEQLSYGAKRLHIYTLRKGYSATQGCKA